MVWSLSKNELQKEVRALRALRARAVAMRRVPPGQRQARARGLHTASRTCTPFRAVPRRGAAHARVCRPCRGHATRAAGPAPGPGVTCLAALPPAPVRARPQIKEETKQKRQKLRVIDSLRHPHQGSSPAADEPPPPPEGQQPAAGRAAARSVSLAERGESPPALEPSGSAGSDGAGRGISGWAGEQLERIAESVDTVTHDMRRSPTWREVRGCVPRARRGGARRRRARRSEPHLRHAPWTDRPRSAACGVRVCACAQVRSALLAADLTVRLLHSKDEEEFFMVVGATLACLQRAAEEQGMELRLSRTLRKQGSSVEASPASFFPYQASRDIYYERFSGVRHGCAFASMERQRLIEAKMQAALNEGCGVNLVQLRNLHNACTDVLYLHDPRERRAVERALHIHKTGAPPDAPDARRGLARWRGTSRCRPPPAGRARPPAPPSARARRHRTPRAAGPAPPRPGAARGAAPVLWRAGLVLLRLPALLHARAAGVCAAVRGGAASGSAAARSRRPPPGSAAQRAHRPARAPRTSGAAGARCPWDGSLLPLPGEAAALLLGGAALLRCARHLVGDVP